MKSKLYTFLTCMVLLLALFQSPFLYYYTSGFLGIVIIACYLIFGFILSLTLLILLVNSRKKYTIQICFVILSFVLGLISLLLGDTIMEQIDWKLRLNSRNEIVDLVKNGTIVPNYSNTYIATLDNWKFPPISNGGNDITINKINDSILTVEFFIERGFLDHYSVYVYTNDPNQIKIIHNNSLYYKKITENWYRVSY